MVNTFVFIAEEDSEEFITEIYHDFMKWCCGLDIHTKSIFESSDLWYELRNQILDQTYEINHTSTDGATFSVTKNGVTFNGTLGFTSVLNESPFTHTVTLSGGLTIEMHDQFLNDIVVSERTFRLLVVNPDVITNESFLL